MVRVGLGRAFGELEVVFVGHLVQGVLGAGKQFAGVAVTIPLGQLS